MGYTTSYTVTRDMSIKDFLRREAGISATLIKRAKYGGVRINGEVVHMRATVRVGDTVTVTVEEEHSDIPPIDLPLDILYEDEDLIAVNKPFGMPMHPCRGNHLPTLANAVAAHYGSSLVFRAVGRLDRDTSGIVIVAKHAIAAARLSAAMKNADFEKIYTAVVEGVPQPPEGCIDAPIAREAEGMMRRTVREDGKHAVTEYTTLGQTSEGDSLVRLRLITGRTHQIRVHMAYIGHPLRDDFLYGTPREGRHYCLHATELSFPHPSSGERIRLFSPPPFLTKYKENV